MATDLSSARYLRQPVLRRYDKAWVQWVRWGAGAIVVLVVVDELRFDDRRVDGTRLSFGFLGASFGFSLVATERSAI